MSEAKPFCISKWEVWEAYKRVKANKGAAGVDEQTIEDFAARRPSFVPAEFGFSLSGRARRPRRASTTARV
jgi:hypothetical protein